MVFFSSRISPFTSTVIFLERSPVATAVVTSAMFLTCAVRLPAIEFTLSVRSFQVPETPLTSACPPSLPSVPTSRATRVTSLAKDESWSTIVLMVFFSSRISPFTSTVIFLERSPVATAVVTSAMFLTCAVRLPAIEFTLSVRSFQVPETPLTSACPPSLPSVPTSRATRVTSLAKDESWSTMVFTSCAVRRNSPFSGRPSISIAIVCERSPLATAPMTRDTSDIGCTRSPMSAFTASTLSLQPPETSPRESRRLSCPSRPTAPWMRRSSAVSRSLRSIDSLSASATFAATPVYSGESRAEKSPLRKAVSTARSSRVSSSFEGRCVGVLRIGGSWGVQG